VDGLAKKHIGITGTIGSGKSTVGEILRGRGFPVLDADACVHSLYRDCAALRKQLAVAFGQECLTAGGVNRKFFAELIFKDDSAREKLESLVYTYLTDAVREFFAANSSPVFLEAALLHRIPEVVDLLDQVWLVDAPAQVRLERLEQRGLSRDDAQRRIETQGDLTALWAGAGTPLKKIDNASSLEQLEGLVAVTLESLVKAR
jgi:dephospho-CoA kinase